MLSRSIIIPDKEATLETLFYLGKTVLHGEETKKAVDPNKTVLEISCYPGTDKRLEHNLHAVIFIRKDAEHLGEQEERICPNSEAANMVLKQYKSDNVLIKQYDVRACAVDYVKNTKTGDMLYSSRKEIENHFARRRTK